MNRQVQVLSSQIDNLMNEIESLSHQDRETLIELIKDKVGVSESAKKPLNSARKNLVSAVEALNGQKAQPVEKTISEVRIARQQPATKF